MIGRILDDFNFLISKSIDGDGDGAICNIPFCSFSEGGVLRLQTESLVCDPHKLPVLTCTQRAACLAYLTEWKLNTCHSPLRQILSTFATAERSELRDEKGIDGIRTKHAQTTPRSPEIDPNKTSSVCSLVIAINV